MNNIEKLKRKIPMDYATVFIYDSVSRIFMLAVTIILIRGMTELDYADYVKFSSVSNLILGMVGGSISLVYIKFATESRSRNIDNSKTIYLTSTLLIVFVSILVFPFINILVSIYDSNYNIVIFSVFFGLLLSLLNLNQAFYQSKENYRKAGYFNNYKNIVFLVFLLCLLLIGGSLEVKYIIAISFLSVLLAFYISFKNINSEISIFSKGLNFNFKEIDNLTIIKESFWILIYMFILNIFNQLDIIMISSLSNAKDLAQYGVAFKYYSLLLTLLPSIKAVLRVKTSKKDFLDQKNIRRTATIEWLKKSSYIVIPIFVVIIFTSDYFMHLINGEKYDESIMTFKILAIGVAFSYIFATSVNMMISARKYYSLISLSVIALCFNYSFNLLLIPLYGIEGAAITTIISHIIINIGSTFLIIKRGKNE
ncbi:polysaccharide biosynthesis C-terminal domain-containing protein [Exiguobacterium sp. N4-1P]|uniref:oligosaccharide flippase family protein n=1 Tax=Exiguobacterium sp. N4-1P TaxID=2051906 RepID=UPI00138FF457|nr:polysaccharide biosynthesis C-terminal domain-containing protein [Exiguobacterium sp. N4-1P]